MLGKFSGAILINGDVGMWGCMLALQEGFQPELSSKLKFEKTRRQGGKEKGRWNFGFQISDFGFEIVNRKSEIENWKSSIQN
jgi:hypothetical protein